MKNSQEKISLGNRIGDSLDKIIGILAPKTAYRRMVYRRAGDIMVSGFYKGAGYDRLKSSWIPGRGSADQNLLLDLHILRERSRDLNANDPRASGITKTLVNNTVGTGIRLQSRISAEDLGITDEQAHKLQGQCEKIWEKWCGYADAANRMDFYEIQRLIDRQILESGEGLFIPAMLNDPNRPYSLALDIIEPDRLRTPFAFIGDKNIRGGVRVGDRGEPLSYFISKKHPGDYLYGGGSYDFQYTEIPTFNNQGRKNIIHIYEIERPGQTRGIPFFTPVLDYFKHLVDYEEAELVAARISACYALIIETENSASASIAASDETNLTNQRLEKLEPGMIKRTAPGEKVESFNPARPSGNFDPFVFSILRAICTGLNLPYEIVSKDFTKTNYSSARAALLQAYRYFKQRQVSLSNKLCQPVYEMLLEEAYLRGELDVPDYYARRYDYNKARWITPGWQWVDPLKEAEAAELSINNGISTLADECASRGDDWEEKIEQRAREVRKIQELEKKYGIQIINQQNKPKSPIKPNSSGSETLPGDPNNPSNPGG